MRALLAVTLLAACSTEPAADPAAGAAAAAAEAVCGLFTKAGETCTVEGTTAKGPVDVALSASAGEQVEVGGRAMLDLSITATAGSASFTCTAAGAGGDLEGASRDGVQQWADRCGTAIVDALVDSGTSAALGEADADGEPLSLTVGPWRAYPGKTTMRGQLKGGPGGNHPMLLSFLEPELKGLGGAAPHFVHLDLTMNGRAATAASCTIDGQDAPALCALARSFPWPEGQPAYVVKQAYALTPKRPGDDPPADAAPAEADPPEVPAKAGKAKAR